MWIEKKCLLDDMMRVYKFSNGYLFIRSTLFFSGLEVAIPSCSFFVEVHAFFRTLNLSSNMPPLDFKCVQYFWKYKSN